MRQAKEYGFSDAQLAEILDKSEKDVRAMRKDMGIVATFKLVDTCAAEFEAYTPYYYSTYETEDEAIINNQKRKSKKKKIMILGGGPNRIGQGIEFDYCCCHAAFALKEMGFETIMVNSNPETVSTDYDTSDRLYFEPLTFEDVMNVFEVEKPDGVIVQFGGQTPLNLARRLSQAGVPIIGTTVDSIDLAENREHFSKLMDQLGIKTAGQCLDGDQGRDPCSRPTASVIRSWSGLPMCWAGARCALFMMRNRSNHFWMKCTASRAGIRY